MKCYETEGKAIETSYRRLMLGQQEYACVRSYCSIALNCQSTGEMSFPLQTKELYLPKIVCNRAHQSIDNYFCQISKSFKGLNNLAG